VIEDETGVTKVAMVKDMEVDFNEAKELEEEGGAEEAEEIGFGIFLLIVAQATAEAAEAIWDSRLRVENAMLVVFPDLKNI